MMAVLRPRGNAHRSLERQSRKAEDDAGNRVVVNISHEAIQDYEEPECWQTAEWKYGSGNYEIKSGERHVQVMTADVQNFRNS